MSYRSFKGTYLSALWKGLRPQDVEGDKTKRQHKSAHNKTYAEDQVSYAVAEIVRLNEHVAAFLDQHRAHHREDKSENEKSFGVAKRTFWLTVFAVFFSFAAALGTIASAFLNVVAISDGRKILREAHAQSQAARDQANAARDQALTARKQLADSDRAWLDLVVQNQTISLTWGEGVVVHFTIGAVNQGTSPAFDVNIEAAVIIKGVELAHRFPNETDKGFKWMNDELNASRRNVCETDRHRVSGEPMTSTLFVHSDTYMTETDASYESLGQEITKASRPGVNPRIEILACVTYKIVGDSDFHRSRKEFLIAAPSGPETFSFPVIGVNMLPGTLEAIVSMLGQENT